MRKATGAMGRAIGPLVAGLTLAVAPAAHGQSPAPAGNKVAAEALFEDGRTLVAAGKFAEACPKFADSEKLDPSASTLLNLANCWEKVGRTATAWATYKEAASLANGLGRKDYGTAALRHAESLAPKLARLPLALPHPLAGLQVKRDGALADRAACATP